MKGISRGAKLLGLAIALCLVPAALYSVRSWQRIFTGNWIAEIGRKHVSPYTNQELAEFTERTGEMTAQESLRRDALELSVTKTGKISNADLSWVIHMVQTDGTYCDPIVTQTRHLDMMLVLKQLRIFAPGQKEKIYDVTSPFLASASSNEKVGAMAAMRAIKDKRASPAVAALLNDSDSLVREQAKKTLNIITPGRLAAP